MQDLLRDWRRWSRTERLVALVLLALLTLGVPTLVLSTGLPGAEHATEFRN